ncbi:MAG: flagellar protein FliT [Selenomonadaceae bacterium]
MNTARLKVEDLWEKYYMLSAEMLKFITSDEVDMFLQLLEQRTAIQQLLEKIDDRIWPKTTAGQALYAKLKPVDMQLQYNARLWLNKSKQKNQAVKSYDILGGNPAGQLFNKNL